MPVAKDRALVTCRTIGHSWDDLPVVPGSVQVPTIRLRCTRCTTERFDEVNAAGGVDHRRYQYPDWYQLTKDQRQPKTAWRLLFMSAQASKPRRTRSS